jgi:hypothetical protein
MIIHFSFLFHHLQSKTIKRISYLTYLPNIRLYSQNESNNMSIGDENKVTGLNIDLFQGAIQHLHEVTVESARSFQSLQLHQITE